MTMPRKRSLERNICAILNCLAVVSICLGCLMRLDYSGPEFLEMAFMQNQIERGKLTVKHSHCSDPYI